jgi:hypothetical protein
MEETEGDSRACLPWRGRDGKVVVGGTLGRRARSHGGGGAPVLPWPREEAEGARVDVAELPVASACTGRRRSRQIYDGGAWAEARLHGRRRREQGETQLGFAGSSVARYKGARDPEKFVARTPRRPAAAPAVAASAFG